MADQQQRTTPGMKSALTIAGSDPSGGAGIQADLKTWATMQLFGCSVLTAVTAQNTKGVQRIAHLDPDLVEAQIESVAGDIDCAATKVGMLGTVEIADRVAAAVKRHQLQPLVVDPVMVAKSGDALVEDAVAERIALRLFKLAAVVTPNRFEAARLLKGQQCETIPQGIAAAKQIAKKYGCYAVIVKGFTRPGPQPDSPPEAVDVFWTGEEIVELVGERRQSTNVHGAGCVLSAAIVGGLAQGKPLNDAVEQAKRLVTESIRQNVSIGTGGHGSVNHLAWLNVKK